MEIRKYLDIEGVVVVEDIVEGRMVLFTENTAADLAPGADQFGSQADLPGVKLPEDEAEANEATFALTWPVSNATVQDPIRLFITAPSFDFALRRGFDQAENIPFNADVHLTWPGNKEGVVIPEGYQGLAFARGVFRVLSGQFVPSAAVEIVGTNLSVANTADDGAGESGKLQEQSGSEVTVAIVQQFNDTDGSLTFRTL